MKTLKTLSLFLFIILSSSCGDESTGTPVATSENLTPLMYPPADLSKVAFIEPMGRMGGNHVTPTDHQYFCSFDFDTGKALEINVYSPASGTITSIQHMGSWNQSMDDYRLVVKHSQDISSVYIHIDKLSDKIAAYAPAESGYVNVDIPVSAGEILGNYSGTLDYNVVDLSVTLTGFVLPESYTHEEWKIHCPDPFDYFKETVKSQLVAKCLRTAAPVGGRIDHDVDGRLVGSWFLEGTNGYAGIDQNNYFVGHIAIAYNNIDPEHIIVSFGDYDGEPQQFGVRGNSPDPATVDMSTDLVEYEFVHYDFYDGDLHWDRETLVKGLDVRNYSFVQGVVLFQLIDERRLKVELFPGMEASEVDGFTANARIYVR